MFLTLSSLFFAASVQTAPAAPQWTFKEATDANGKRSASATIRAEDGTGRLGVRCDTVVEPIVSVQFIPRPPLAASDAKMVTMTFDEAKAETAPWQYPGGGAYMAEAYDVFMVVSQIAAAKKVRIVAENGAGELIQSEFDGPGNDAMFRKVYETCGRTYALPVVAPPKR